MIVRPARPDDVPRMAGVDAGAGPFPWTEQRLRQVLGEVTGAAALVADTGGAGGPVDIAGFVLFSCHLDEGTVLNIAVHAARQERGLGRELLEAALQHMRAGGMRRCLLEVRRSNEAALALYRGAGFVEDGMRKNYYPAAAGREDAILLSLTLRDEGRDEGRDDLPGELVRIDE